MVAGSALMECDHTISESLTEVWPSVIFDIGVGRLVTNIEVDIQYIADTLSHAGMSNEAIAQTTLHFTDQTIVEDEDSNDSKHKFGEHDHDTHTAFIHMGTLEHYVSGRGDVDAIEVGAEVLNLMATWRATESTLHEIYHEVEEVTVGGDALKAEQLEHYGIDTRQSRATRFARWIMNHTFTARSKARMEELVIRFEAIDNQRKNKKYAEAIGSHKKYLSLPYEKRASDFSEGIVMRIKDGDRNYPVTVELRVL